MSVVTISAIKADVGGYVGDCAVHPDLLAEAAQRVRDAVGEGLLIDGSVSSCGDDVNLVMTHRHGVDAELVHHFAWDTFVALTDVVKSLHRYGAGEDLLADLRDLLGSFDRARAQALEMADYMRRMGRFEPGRLPMEEMEYTTLSRVAERMHERWEAIAELAPSPAQG